MFEEHNQLCDRIKKLQTFICSPRYDDIQEIDKADLKEQLQCMQGYFEVLSRRVSRQCNSA